MTEDPPHEPDDASDDGSLRPIRALTRGLEALEALNARGQASVTEIARAIGLPRTTAYRVLETLCAGGYAERTAEDRYRLLARVQRLADGYAPPAWLERIVKPATAALVRELSWPLYFAVLEGTELRAYDLGSEPRIPERWPLTTPIATNYLQACSENQRKALALLAGGAEVTVAERETQQGLVFAVDWESRVEISVPVIAGDAAIGMLALRLPAGAIPPEAVARFGSLISAAANEIAAAWTEQRKLGSE